MKVERPFKPTGKRLDNLNNLIQTKYPQDKWVLEPILPIFLSIIDSSSTIEQQEKIIDLLNKVFNDYEFRYNTILEIITMNKDTLRMQMLSGVITEGEYKAKLEEKESLNEHYIAGGIVGVGAINNPFEGRKKESYEDAFEHFLGQKYNLKEAEEEVEEGKEVEEPSLYEGELNENIGSSIEKMIDGAKFEFSEKGNDEMIELANYILTPEGAKNVAMSLKNRLKGEGGENYFTSKPEALQSLLDKLK